MPLYDVKKHLIDLPKYEKDLDRIKFLYENNNFKQLIFALENRIAKNVLL